MTTTPGGFNPDLNPEPWRPGIDKVGGPPPGKILDGPYPEVKIPSYPVIEGFEGVSFNKEKSIDPPPLTFQRGEPRVMAFEEVSKIDATSCRNALLQHVSENCCYGSRPAKDMEIIRFDGITALHYILESFTERRCTTITLEPYRGGAVDGPENGSPPIVWNIPCDPGHLFESHTKTLEVPHTSVIRQCCHCDTRGWMWCWKCGGVSRIRCLKCKGKGNIKSRDLQSKRNKHETCAKCRGAGKVRCSTCSNDGRIICSRCDGYRMLRCFIQVIVAFTNHADDYFLESTDIPDDLVKAVDGKIVFQDIQPLVWPINSFPVEAINENSTTLVEAHKTSWKSERILNQRQTLRGVPVTEVLYSWKNNERIFWVYGNEQKVYAPDYPHTCCWGCTIL